MKKILLSFLIALIMHGSNAKARELIQDSLITNKGEVAARLYLALLDTDISIVESQNKTIIQAKQIICTGEVSDELGIRTYLCIINQIDNSVLIIHDIYLAQALDSALMENGAYGDGSTGNSTTIASDITAEMDTNVENNKIFFSSIKSWN